MNDSIIEHAVNQFKELFREDVTHQLAFESRLIQRDSSKLNPMAFLMVMVVEMSLLGTLSLSRMCDLFMVHGGVRMTAQALSLRLGNASTVRFLKSAYAKVLKLNLSNISSQLQQKGILSRFGNVYLEDSTSCSLHEKVQDAFKGNGGKGSKAGYKIHTIWNATQSSVEQMLVTPSNNTDGSQAFNIISFLKPGDLVLRDLGYFSLSCFREIDNTEAYFLSRLKAGVKVYTPDNVLIEDLANYIEEKALGSATTRVEVILGARERLRVSLVACQVPQSVYDQRVRKLRRKAQKNGRTPSKATLRLNRYTFFITNIPEERLAATEMATLYKLRWAIELLFKSFKSDLHIDMIKGQLKHRVECFIISKLIAVMVVAVLFTHFSMDIALSRGRELSFTKFVRWILAHKYLTILFCPEILNYEVMQMKNIDILDLCKQERSRESTKTLLEREATYEDLYPLMAKMQPLTELA